MRLRWRCRDFLHLIVGVELEGLGNDLLSRPRKCYLLSRPDLYFPHGVDGGELREGAAEELSVSYRCEEAGCFLVSEALTWEV